LVCGFFEDAMLSELSIRDVVLIDRLDLSFNNGLTVMTGETGAGKSILLDSLNLALGGRGDASLVRHGQSEAIITASFEIVDTGFLADLLSEIGIEEKILSEELLVLRRVMSRDGRTRAYVNDQLVSVSTLKKLGNVLVEIQGQFDATGLMNPTNHRYFLDVFSNHSELLGKVDENFIRLSEAKEKLKDLRNRDQDITSQRDFLRFSASELSSLQAEDGEEEKLTKFRSLLVNAEKNIQSINEAIELLAGDAGAVILLSRAQRILDNAGGEMLEITESLDRALTELNLMENKLFRLAGDIELDSGKLDETEHRLSELRAAARKHGILPDELPELTKKLMCELESLENVGESLVELEGELEIARKEYLISAEKLSASRAKNAASLDKRVMKELPSLKLEKTKFGTIVSRLDEVNWGREGIDSVEFEVSTNPGVPVGSLNKVASGGERSRFLLALRVALLAASPVPTLVFDEVDSGVGGSVASAVGERLQKLGKKLQVLVVTHSPQVAAKGHDHWQISKALNGESAQAIAVQLQTKERIEEIGRMLAGETITAEALAAAEKLMES
tara:strand:+ start:406 stop:2094 length:1689 start_codon:yes stop_codon:yes gene_type:complete